jgi:hypothetical protein
MVEAALLMRPTVQGYEGVLFAVLYTIYSGLIHHILCSVLYTIYSGLCCTSYTLICDTHNKSIVRAGGVRKNKITSALEIIPLSAQCSYCTQHAY